MTQKSKKEKKKPKRLWGVFRKMILVKKNSLNLNFITHNKKYDKFVQIDVKVYK